MKRWGRWYSASMWNNGHYQSNRIQKIVMPEHEVPVIDDLTAYVSNTGYEKTKKLILRNTDWKQIPMNFGHSMLYTAYDKYVDMIFNDPEGGESPSFGYLTGNSVTYTEYLSITAKFYSYLPKNGKYFLGFRLYPFSTVYGYGVANKLYPVITAKPLSSSDNPDPQPYAYTSGALMYGNTLYRSEYVRQKQYNPRNGGTYTEWEYPEYNTDAYDIYTTTMGPLLLPNNKDNQEDEGYVNSDVGYHLRNNMPNFPDPSEFYRQNPQLLPITPGSEPNGADGIVPYIREEFYTELLSNSDFIAAGGSFRDYLKGNYADKMPGAPVMNMSTPMGCADFWDFKYSIFYNSTVSLREPDITEQHPQVFKGGGMTVTLHPASSDEAENQAEGWMEVDLPYYSIMNTVDAVQEAYDPLEVSPSDPNTLAQRYLDPYSKEWKIIHACGLPALYSPRISNIGIGDVNVPDLGFWVLPAIYDAAGNMIV